MTEEELAEIKARCEAATEGPWAVGEKSHHDGGRPTDEVCVPGEYGRKAITHFAQEEDVVFIAHARQDVPALLAEVERLREALNGIGKFLYDQGILGITFAAEEKTVDGGRR